MQLTKDDLETDTDIKENYDEFGKSEQYIGFSKFQQVVMFYEKYKYHEELLRSDKELWNIWASSKEYKIYVNEMRNKNYVIAEEWYNDWLFSYCFKQGLGE